MTAIRLVDPPAPAPDPDAGWMTHAACRGMDPNLFMPARGDWQAVAAAKAVCHGCPVIQQCLTHALDTNEKHGVWGGLSERQRRELRSKRVRPPKKLLVDRIADLMACGAVFSADMIRVRLGQQTHSGIAQSLRTLTEAGRVKCVRPYTSSASPALYQICGGEPNS